MNRRRRFLAALVAIAALLFSQLSVAAYVCAKLAPPAPVEIAMADCDHSAADNPNLCAQHCLYGDASTGSAPPAPPAADEVVALATWPSLVVSIPHSARRLDAVSCPPQPPPLAARFTVLRI